MGLESSLNLLSVGRLVQQDGCEFHWSPGEGPLLLNRNGERIPAVVRDYVPQIVGEGEESAANAATSSTAASSTDPPPNLSTVVEAVEEEILNIITEVAHQARAMPAAPMS